MPSCGRLLSLDITPSSPRSLPSDAQEPGRVSMEKLSEDCTETNSSGIVTCLSAG